MVSFLFVEGYGGHAQHTPSGTQGLILGLM